MEQHRAALLLGFDGDTALALEPALETVQQQCFDLKDYAFRNTVIPVLFRKRIRAMLDLYRAFETLFPTSTSELGAHNLKADELNQLLQDSDPVAKELALLDSQQINLIEWLRAYESELSRLKLQLAQQWHPLSIAFHLRCLVELQLGYHTRLITVFEPGMRHAFENAKVIDANIKAAEQVSSGKLIVLAEQLGWNSSTSKAALQQQIELLLKSENADLLRPFLSETLRVARLSGLL